MGEYLKLTDELCPAETNEKALLAGMARKEPDAWETFFDRYGDLVYSQIDHVLRRSLIVLPEGLVEDTVQSLYLSFLERDGRKLLLYEDRKGASLKAWLRTVATHHAIQSIRGRKNHLSLDADLEQLENEALKDDQSSDRIRDSLDEERQWKQVECAVKRLSARDRMVFQYYYREERNREEIALIMQIKPNHVDQLLFRIRDKLSLELKLK